MLSPERHWQKIEYRPVRQELGCVDAIIRILTIELHRIVAYECHMVTEVLERIDELEARKQLSKERKGTIETAFYLLLDLLLQRCQVHRLFDNFRVVGRISWIYLQGGFMSVPFHPIIDRPGSPVF
jgi:hypothetical protein